MNNEPIISFTAKAIQHINKSLIKMPQGGFRLSIKKTGCSGYEYLPEIRAEPKSGDIEYITEEGLRVFVDSKFLRVLQGTVVDIEKKILGQQQLTFKNPHVDSACGCGKSVHFTEGPGEDSNAQ